MSGLVSMVPSSIAYTGTGASFNSAGSVTVTACTSISLNGVFTSSYTNYILWTDCVASAQSNLSFRYRASGSDETTNEYNNQGVQILGSVAAGGSRTIAQTVGDFGWLEADHSVNIRHIFGPMLSLRTQSWQDSYLATTNQIIDFVDVLNTTSQYDGITIYHASNNITGTIHVWAYAE